MRQAPSSMRIADIASRWGFASATVFSRAFKEAYGMSPTEAREAFDAHDKLLLEARQGESGFQTINAWLRETS